MCDGIQAACAEACPMTDSQAMPRIKNPRTANEVNALLASVSDKTKNLSMFTTAGLLIASLRE